MAIRADTSLKKHCSLKIGGNAREVLIPESEQELIELYSAARSVPEKFRVIGKGSNLLFLDTGFDGLIIKNTRACRHLEMLEGRYGVLRNRRRLYVGSSISNQKLIKFCAELNLSAPTYLQSVPGNIGGAIFMNAGTGLTEKSYFSDFVQRVKIFDGRRISWIHKNDCGFEYRRSRFMNEDFLILGCEIECRKANGDRTRQEAAERIEFAKATQDDSFPNAGSVFNRGYRDIKIIRGMRQGGAMFSEKTCNWIVNVDEASSEDVLTLIDRAVSEHRNAGLSEPQLEWEIVS